MIVLLEGIRTGRIQALRALRMLNHWPAEKAESGTYGEPYRPGLKEALDMANALPIRIRIWPDDLPKFEEDFHVRTLSDMPSDHIRPGGCVCGPDVSPHGPMPWAAVHFPGGVLAIGGGVGDLADMIHGLLGDGHPEDRITIEFLGGGPTRNGSGPVA